MSDKAKGNPKYSGWPAPEQAEQQPAPRLRRRGTEEDGVKE